MKYKIIDMAKKIYRYTSNRIIRGFYFRIFCAIVRNRTIEVAIEGSNYKLDLGENIDLQIYLKMYEPDVKAAIRKFCKRGFVVLDIGANIGAHALDFANIIGETGKVYAFEPTDYAYSKLEQNVSINNFKNIFPVKVALSDKNLQQQEINFRSSWPTNGKVVEHVSTVDFVRLDEWINEKEIKHVDLIKLDVDGNEYSVIMGAKALLESSHPMILMEVWGPNFSSDEKNPFIVLNNLGYKFFNIETGEEYKSISDLKNLVSKGGELLDFSVNIIAENCN